MNIRTIRQSDQLPLDIAEIQTDLRVDSDDDADKLTRAALGACDFIERRTGLVLIQSEFEVAFPNWCCSRTWCIERAPLRVLQSISYLDQDKASQDVDLADFHTVLRQSSFEVLPLSTFTPPSVLYVPDAIKLRFEAGFDSATADSTFSGDDHELPHGVRLMLIALTGHYYKNLELFEGDKIAEVELGAGSLLAAYRKFW